MAKKLVDNVDEDIWNKFAGLSKIKDKSVGEYLTEIMKEHLEREGIIKEIDKNVWLLLYSRLEL